MKLEFSIAELQTIVTALEQQQRIAGLMIQQIQGQVAAQTPAPIEPPPKSES